MNRSKCEWCDKGNIAKDGWHIVPYDDPRNGSFKVSCLNAPPKDTFTELLGEAKID